MQVNALPLRTCVEAGRVLAGEDAPRLQGQQRPNRQRPTRGLYRAAACAAARRALHNLRPFLLPRCVLLPALWCDRTQGAAALFMPLDLCRSLPLTMLLLLLLAQGTGRMCGHLQHHHQPPQQVEREVVLGPEELQGERMQAVWL